MSSSLNNWLQQLGLNSSLSQQLEPLLLLFLVALIGLLTKMASGLLWAKLLAPVVHRSSTQWDDALAHSNFFQRAMGLFPLLLSYICADLLLLDYGQWHIWTKRLLLLLLVLTVSRTIDAALQATEAIYRNYDRSRQRPISGYISALRIFVFVLAAIFTVAVIANKSPWGILSVFGGLTAVMLLIFKDSLLGLTANLQLTSNNMINVGDWIEVPKYQADGDVLDIGLHTVRVQNWDKTIISIPTYALISEGFKNWRGMSESGGRRIKRAIAIDMASIHFCDDELLQRLGQITLLAPYLHNKGQEISQANATQTKGNPANLRRQTNIGVFRAYVEAYLRNHEQINQELTFLIRQLHPTPQGLPLEIYVFSKDKVWANYERIQADIFDHLLAILPEFELRAFQYPAGQDLQRLATLP